MMFISSIKVGAKLTAALTALSMPWWLHNIAGDVVWHAFVIFMGITAITFVIKLWRTTPSEKNTK